MMKTYVCKHCGKEYKPKVKDRIIYCSRECSYADKKAKPKVKIIPKCIVCGKEFEGRINKKYCSDECHKEYYKEYFHNKYLGYKESEQYQLDLEKLRNNYGARPWHEKICQHCNKKFKTRETSKTCCAKCTKHIKNKPHKGNVSKARRSRVFMRDNYKCQICGKKMKMDKSDTLGTSRPHLMAPTIDHIIPISIAKQLGWTNIEIHRESNLQSAHLICNIKKSNNAMNDQLRLY